MTASRLEFRILGPLSVRVDGAPVPLGGPKQRALLALLLLSANRVVSRDRLIGELFVEQGVNAADHALRNHVSRLRKVLAPAAADEPRLVARAPGYLLRVEPGELDLERFERLVAEGREVLAAGDAPGAAEALRAAERLWQGRPLADLELEPFARIDADRLEELRLSAVEERIDADLALGRHSALVPELEALAAEQPYRERFRAQLMLALYRSGRQVEGLEVFRRTRSLLNDELGLEPGAELQELQRAILVQEPSLAPAVGNTSRRRWPLRDVCPFKGLAPFEPADAEFFFGRERLVDELLGRIKEGPSLLAIVGASGSGKSSLLRAGLLPALGRAYALLRPGDELPSPGDVPVLAVDQLEELFAPGVQEAERRALVTGLVEAAWDPERRTLVLIALRADFFGQLARYGELADLVGPNHVLLGPLSASELRRAIEAPADRAGLEVEPTLVDALIDAVAGEPGALPLLSTALADLWHERDGRTLTLAAYERAGGVHGAVARHAESAFRSLADDERPVARRVLLRLVSGGEGEAFLRRRVTRAELEADDDERVGRVLEALIEQRLLVADHRTVELVHEALLGQWPRLRSWLEDDARGRRLHLGLAQAASEWEASGREQGELYRGARLAAALEWADAAGEEAGLNRLEREFLEESRRAFARANRRLRALLAIALVLLAAAVVAGAVALSARSSARRQATAAIAERLGAQALVEPRLDRALLLAREGAALDDSLATRSNLLAVLLRSPAALTVLRSRDDRVLDDALSPDGRLLAIRGNNGSVQLFDTRALREVGPPYASIGQLSYYGAIVRPVRALAFSPDGRTLAVGDSDGRHPTLVLVDTRTQRARPAARASGVATADVAFAPDGRTLVTGDATSGALHPTPERLTLRRASDGRVLRRSRTVPGGRLIGFPRGGRFLLVTSGERTSYLLDSRTFARVRTFRLGGGAALSPVADTAAFGQDDGNVELLDLRTGTVQPMARRASGSGSVTGLAFSPDGETLATTSDDGSVDIWDVPTRGLRETFSGHTTAAVGPAFSPDGSTLYTASNDGSVIAWDVRGLRRLGRPFRFSPTASAGEGPRAPAPGAASAVAVSPDGLRFVTATAPNRVTIWRARDLTVLGELHGPSGPFKSLAWSHHGRLVAASGDAGETVVWDARTHRVLMRLGHAGPIGAIGFSPDDSLLGVAGLDGLLRVYDVRGDRPLVRARVKGSLEDLDFSPDGRRIASAGLAGDLLIWNPRTGRLERTIHQASAFISLRFSSDGKEIATGDIGGNVEFWDPATGRRVGRKLAGQNGAVISVAYSPGGPELLTTSTDGKLRLWDLVSGKLIGAPLPGGATGGSGTFFPDGKHVIVAFSGAGVIWSVDPPAWQTHACSLANRTLTRAEWHDLLPERGYRPVCP